MFLEQNHDDALEAARKFLIKNGSREKSRKYWKLIEKYAADNDIIIGGPAAVDILIGNKPDELNTQFSITLWTNTRAVEHAIALSKGIYDDGEKLAGYKLNMDSSYTVLIGVSQIVRIQWNEKLYKAATTRKSPAIFNTGLNVLCLDEYLLLGETYYRLLSPMETSKTSLLENELLLTEFARKMIRRKFKNGESYLTTSAISHDDLDKLFTIAETMRENSALCGEKAISLISGEDIYEGRAQFVISTNIREWDSAIRNAFSGQQIYFARIPIEFPGAPVLTKYTFYVNRKPLCDLFNLPMYTAVPTVQITKTGEISTSKDTYWIRMCNLLTLLYMRIIDMYSLAYLGLETSAENIIANISYLRDYDGKFADSKYLFPVDKKRYIGYCSGSNKFVKKTMEKFTYWITDEKK